MKLLTTTALSFATVLPLLAITAPAQAAMSSHIENALVDVCKAAKNNRVHHLNATLKSYNLKAKTVAIKVMCNGEDIVSYAEQYGANKTANKLEQSIGNVSITDIAAVSKIYINFEE